MACIRKRGERLILDFYDQTGKRQRQPLEKGTKLKDAKKMLRDIEEKVEKGVYIPTPKVPLFPEVADMWLKMKKPNLRHSTYNQYEGHLKNHLNPFFENDKVSVINYDKVEKFILHCIDKKMHHLTMKKILINLGAIMTYAVRKRYIDYNPVRDVEKPKGQSTFKEDKQINALTPEQIRLLIDAAPDLKHKTLFMAAVTTGLRQGELIGLRWTDVDWFNNQIQVSRTYNHAHFYEPKTRGSRRKVDVPAQMMKQFKVWKVACISNDLVFPNKFGRPMSSLSMYNRVWLPMVKQLGLHGVRFHDLRHTYASLMIDQDENIKYIQSQLGHSSITTTMDTYGHLLKDVNNEAANRLGNAIFNNILQKPDNKQSL